MKKYLSGFAVLLGIASMLGGCVQVVNTIPSGSSSTGGMEILEEGEEASDHGEVAASRPEEEEAEEEIRESVKLVISEDTYEEIRLISPNALYAVKNGGKWGVIESNGKELFPAEYDYLETDGKGFFSLTLAQGDSFDACLIYYDTQSGSMEEVFTNESYPELDFTAVYSPYITMSDRKDGGLNVLYVEADHFGGFDFDFYRLSRFDAQVVQQSGFNPGKWDGVSGFVATMTSDGGSFISSEDWTEDNAGYYNVVGIDGLNQIVLSESERGRTLQMMPYAADDLGYYAAWIVTLPAGSKVPAYGNVSGHDFSAAGLKAFPSAAEDVIPDDATGVPTAGRGGRIVLQDSDGNLAVFNMETGKIETEFAYREVVLSGSERYPSVVRDGQRWQYLTPSGALRDTGEPAYAAASLYDETMAAALVIDEAGSLYAIDRNGVRVSAKEESDAEATLRYLSGKDSHAYVLEQDGSCRLCTLKEK